MKTFALLLVAVSLFAQDASKINTHQTGTGAVSRSVQSTLNDTINAASFGAKCNNISLSAMINNDTAGINASIAAAHNNGVVNLSRTNGSTYGVNWCVVDSTIFIPSGTILRGGNEASTFIVPSASFPTNTPVVRFDSAGPLFGARLEHVTVSCVPIAGGDAIAGCIGVEMNQVQEGSGLLSVGIQGGSPGIKFDGGYGNQNGSIDGVQIYGVPGTWEGLQRDGWCISGLNVISRYKIQNITCNGSQVSANVFIPYAAIFFTVSNVAIRDIHCEVTDVCISGSFSGFAIENANGGGTHVIYFPSGQNSDYTLINIVGGGGSSLNALTDLSVTPNINCESGGQYLAFFTKQQGGNYMSSDPSCGANFVNTQIVGSGLQMAFGSLQYFKNAGVITGALDLVNNVIVGGQGGGTLLGDYFISYPDYGNVDAAQVQNVTGASIVGSTGWSCDVTFGGSASGDAATGHVFLDATNTINVGDNIIIDNGAQGYVIAPFNASFSNGTFGTPAACSGNFLVNNVVIPNIHTGLHILGNFCAGSSSPNNGLVDSGASDDGCSYVSNNGTGGTGSASGLIMSAGHTKLWGNVGLTNGVGFSPQVWIDASPLGIKFPQFSGAGILAFDGTVMQNDSAATADAFLGSGFFTGTFTYLKSVGVTCTATVTNGRMATPTGAGCP